MSDLEPLVADLRDRLEAAKELAKTEEATKNAVVMPFLRMLGYDVFDPREVIPEFVADVGIKKGEKIDYAIRLANEIAMLVEVKTLDVDLGKAQYSQLYRYFAACKASVALLTNGRRFMFFTDIDAPNKMDDHPFFVFDLESYSDADILELSRFHKTSFDIERIRSTASRLKHVALATAFLRGQFDAPDDEFVRFVARSFHEGNLTAKVVEALRPTVKAAFAQLIRERIERKLRLAFDGPSEASTETPEPEASDIETTPDELQAWYIIKAIAAADVPPSRIAMRDARSYCAILLDDNNRKPICRLHFNGKKQWHVGFMDDDKKEVREPVASPEDLYLHADRIRAAINRFA